MKSLPEIEKIVKQFKVKPGIKTRSRVLDDALEMQKRQKQARAHVKVGLLRKAVKGHPLKIAVAATIMLALSLFFMTRPARHSITKRNMPPCPASPCAQDNTIDLKEIMPCHILPVIPS